MVSIIITYSSNHRVIHYTALILCDNSQQEILLKRGAILKICTYNRVNSRFVDEVLGTHPYRISLWCRLKTWFVIRRSPPQRISTVHRWLDITLWRKISKWFRLKSRLKPRPPLWFRNVRPTLKYRNLHQRPTDSSRFAIIFESAFYPQTPLFDCEMVL